MIHDVWADVSMLNPASELRARSLLRRHWRATVVLGLFGGMAGGAALGVWGIARRTATVYDRFVAYEDAATLSMFTCPDGVDPENDFRNLCAGFDYADVVEFLATVPEVEAAGRLTAALASVSAVDAPESHERVLFQFPIDEGSVAALGRPIVVEGRVADPTVATEVVVNEAAANYLGLGVGDQFVAAAYRVDEFDAAGEGIEPGSGEPMTMNIVGIVRRPSDLAGRLGEAAVGDGASVIPTPAWWEANDGDVASYGVGLLIKPAHGASNDDIQTALRERWPDREMQFDLGNQSGNDGDETVVDAIELQALGIAVVAAVIALAALVFVGQAVARQTRYEWNDVDVLHALGMGRPTMMAAAALRASILVAVAALAAFVVALALSPFGPTGVGRAAEPDSGVYVDGKMLAIGLPLVSLTVLVCAVGPVARLRFRRHPGGATTVGSRSMASLPVTGVAGWSMTTTRRAGGLAIGSAVVGVALASAAGIAAWSLVRSYDALIDNPAAYGAPWDVQVGNVGGDEQAADTRARLEAIPGIRSVGIRSVSGIAGNPSATLMAAEPFIGDVAFGTITAGRAPVGASEAALGRQTLADLGAEIGGTATIVDPSDPERSFVLDVVGEAVINDGLSASPGEGALLTLEGFEALAPDTLSQTYMVWIDPDVDRSATLDALRAEFPTTIFVPPAPERVSNIGLLSNQPALVAFVVGLLAGAALIHALVSSVRRSRRQLGVLKSIGFTGRQVVATVGWHASLLASVALLMGIPLGIAIARVVWTAIVNDLGVVSAPVTPIAGVVVVAIAVLMVANVAAVVPGLVAARTRAAVALRTE